MKEHFDTLAARIGIERTQTLLRARVGIAGLGGLGSNVAIMLARAGVGTLHLVDFDTVDESNLNRQHYFEKHLGTKKTIALSEQLLELNPHLQIVLDQVKVDESNAAPLFAQDPFVVEAFDTPAAKALLVNKLLSATGPHTLISGNGMAGLAPADTMHVRKCGSNLWICGDETSEVTHEALFAPRVQLCASLQALVVLQLILGINPLSEQDTV